MEAGEARRVGMEENDPEAPFSVLDFETGRLEDEFELGEFLGRGTCGITHRCKELSTGEFFACKSIPKSSMDCPEVIECFKREVDIMTRLSESDSIVKLKNLFEDESFLHIIMELCSGGTLMDFIENRGIYFSEEEAANMAKSMSKMLEELHSEGVMHRDLKPDNFLLANSNDLSSLRGADFSHSIFFTHGEKCRGGGGAYAYRAPEVFEGYYGPEMDVWSVGVNLAYLLCGQLPPHPGNQIDFSVHPWTLVSDEAKDLIKRMMDPNPSKRIQPSHVYYHPWVINQGTPFNSAPEYFEKISPLLQEKEDKREIENREVKMQLSNERKMRGLLEKEMEKVKKENEDVEEDLDIMANSLKLALDRQDVMKEELIEFKVKIEETIKEKEESTREKEELEEDLDVMGNCLNSAMNRQDRMKEELMDLKMRIDELMREKEEKEEELSSMQFSLQKSLDLRNMEREVRNRKEEEMERILSLLENGKAEKERENELLKKKLEDVEKERLGLFMALKEMKDENVIFEKYMQQMEEKKEEEKRNLLQVAQVIRSESAKLEKYWEEMERKREQEREMEKECIMVFTETQFLQNKMLENELEKEKKEKERISARLHEECAQKLELEMSLKRKEEYDGMKEKKRKEKSIWENFFFDFEMNSNSNPARWIQGGNKRIKNDRPFFMAGPSTFGNGSFGLVQVQALV